MHQLRGLDGSTGSAACPQSVNESVNKRYAKMGATRSVWGNAPGSACRMRTAGRLTGHTGRLSQGWHRVPAAARSSGGVRTRSGCSWPPWRPRRWRRRRRARRCRRRTACEHHSRTSARTVACRRNAHRPRPRASQTLSTTATAQNRCHHTTSNQSEMHVYLNVKVGQPHAANRLRIHVLTATLQNAGRIHCHSRRLTSQAICQNTYSPKNHTQSDRLAHLLGSDRSMPGLPVCAVRWSSVASGRPSKVLLLNDAVLLCETCR